MHWPRRRRVLRWCSVCKGRVGAPHSRGTCSAECEAVAVTDGL